MLCSYISYCSALAADDCGVGDYFIVLITDSLKQGAVDDARGRKSQNFSFAKIVYRIDFFIVQAVFF